jgi:hypothetical protein
MIHDKYPKIDLSISEDVGMGRVPCPYCEYTEGSGIIAIKAPEGYTEFGYPQDFERVDCPCYLDRMFWRKIYASSPSRYRSLSLNRMAPSPLAKNASLTFQRRVIEHCKSNRLASQFFMGPVGCGKTALQYAMWKVWVGQMVLEYPGDCWGRRWPIWNVDANELLDQHHAWVTKRETEDKGPKYPDVTPELIQSVASRYPLDPYLKPVLVLREIDKLNATEFKIDVLFKIIGRLHDDMGVLILDSNLTWEQFVARFGLPLARRVRVLCHLVDYHTETIKLPSEDEVAATG